MVSNILIILTILLIPRGMVLLSTRFKLFHLLGPVFLCYASGFLLSFIFADTTIAMSISEILVPVSIPLILFSADLTTYKKLAPSITLSFLLCLFSVIIMSTLGFFIFKNHIMDANKISGMMAGLYTGGTPNLIAIAMALEVGETTIVLANTVDLVVGGIYFFLLLSIVPKIVHKFLPSKIIKATGDLALLHELENEFIPVRNFFSVKGLIQRMPLLILSVLCTGLSLAVSLLFTKTLDVMIIILFITALGIGLSFNKKVRNTPNSFSTGQYLIHMFSFAIGLSFSFKDLNYKILPLLLFFAFVQFGSIFLHFLLSKCVGVDGDITVITSTAGIYGPAFVVPVANALDNKKVILPGIICGIIGYAIGNYLGISLSLLLGLFL